jgi:hypothetical protein
VRPNGRVRTTLKAAAKTEAKKRLLEEDIQAEMSIAQGSPKKKVCYPICAIIGYSDPDYSTR